MLDPTTQTYNQLTLQNFPKDIAFNPAGINILVDILADRLFVVNNAGDHGGERVEVFYIEGDTQDSISLTWEQNITFPGLPYMSLQDIAALNSEDFYVTQWTRSELDGLDSPSMW